MSYNTSASSRKATVPITQSFILPSTALGHQGKPGALSLGLWRGKDGLAQLGTHQCQGVLHGVSTAGDLSFRAQLIGVVCHSPEEATELL